MNAVFANAPWEIIVLFIIWKLGEAGIAALKNKTNKKVESKTLDNKQGQFEELTEIIKEQTESFNLSTFEKIDKLSEHMLDLTVQMKQICVLTDTLYSSCDSMHNRLDEMQKDDLKDIFQKLTEISTKLDNLRSKGGNDGQ